MNIFKIYENLNSPYELMEFMDKYITYGFHGTDGVDYLNNGTKEENDIFQKACTTVYGLESPEYVLKYGLGHCWDQVELERDWFIKNGYNIKTNYIWFELNYENAYTTHTYLIYQDKETLEYCLFEHADYENRGIHKFKTYAEAVIWQKDKHIAYNKKIGNIIDDEILTHIHIYEYDKPEYGINMFEFIDYVTSQKEITNITKKDNK